MEPCGTPHVIIVSLDMVPFISVTCVLSVKYDLNHSTVLVSEPIERSLLSKISWLTVSDYKIVPKDHKNVPVSEADNRPQSKWVAFSEESILSKLNHVC